MEETRFCDDEVIAKVQSSKCSLAVERIEELTRAADERRSIDINRRDLCPDIQS